MKMNPHNFEQEIREYFNAKAVDAASLNSDNFTKELLQKIDTYITKELGIINKSNLSVEIEDVFDSEIDTDKKDMTFVVSFTAKGTYICEPKTHDYPGSIDYSNCIEANCFPTMRKDISEIIKGAFQDKNIFCKDCTATNSESFSISEAIDSTWEKTEVHEDYDR